MCARACVDIWYLLLANFKSAIQNCQLQSAYIRPLELTVGILSCDKPVSLYFFPPSNHDCISICQRSKVTKYLAFWVWVASCTMFLRVIHPWFCKRKSCHCEVGQFVRNVYLLIMQHTHTPPTRDRSSTQHLWLKKKKELSKISLPLQSITISFYKKG